MLHSGVGQLPPQLLQLQLLALHCIPDFPLPGQQQLALLCGLSRVPSLLALQLHHLLPGLVCVGSQTRGGNPASCLQSGRK